MQRRGLEWLHRFACEPRRLARRYIAGNTAFGLAASAQWLRHAAASRAARGRAGGMGSTDTGIGSTAGSM
jgi:hypothetical protein